MNTKVKPFCKGVDLGPFRRHVILLVGDMDECLDAFAKSEQLHPDKDLVSRVSARLKEGLESYVKPLGIEFGEGGDSYIYLPEWNSEVFVHEAYHATHDILKYTYIEDPNGEVGARLIGYIFEKFCRSDIMDKKMKEKLK